MLKLLGLIISLLVITSTGRYLRPIKNQYALPYYYSFRRPNRQFDPLADIVQVTTTATLSNSKCVPPTNTCSHDYECPPYHKCFADRFCGYKVCRKVATSNSAAETTTKSRKTNEIKTELPCTDSWNRCNESKEKCEFDSQCPPCFTCHHDVDYGYKVCKNVNSITTTSKPTSIFEATTVKYTPEVMTTEAVTVTSIPAITSDVTISDVTTESIILSSALLKTFDATVSEVTTTESASTNILNLTTSKITTTSVVTSTTTSEVTPLVTTSSTISETTVPVSTIKIPELTESTVLVDAALIKSDNDFDVHPFGPSTRRSDDDFIFDEETVTSASLEFESKETAIYGVKIFENMMSQIPETTVSVISENTTLGPRTTILQPYDEQFSGSGIGSGDEQIDYEESILSTRTPLEDDFSFDEVTQESDSDPVDQISIANRTDRENIKRADSEKVTNIIIGPANNSIIDSDFTKQLPTGTTATTAEDITITTTSTEKTFTEVTNNVTITAPNTTVLEYIKIVPLVKAETAEVVTNEAAKVGTTSYPTTEELLYETSVITEQERFREQSGDVKENKESFQINIVTESPTNEKMKIDNLLTSDKVDEISSKNSSLIDVIGILPDVNPDNYLSNKDYYIILDDYE